MEKAISLAELDSEQWDDWQNVKNAWLADYFIPCLKKYNLRQDCEICGDIMWKVRFTIGEDGIVNLFEILDQRIDCPDQEKDKLKAFDKCISDTISEHAFSNSFSNVIFEVEIGRRTKC